MRCLTPCGTANRAYKLCEALKRSETARRETADRGRWPCPGRWQQSLAAGSAGQSSHRQLHPPRSTSPRLSQAITHQGTLHAIALSSSSFNPEHTFCLSAVFSLCTLYSGHCGHQASPRGAHQNRLGRGCEVCMINPARIVSQSERAGLSMVGASPRCCSSGRTVAAHTHIPSSRLQGRGVYDDEMVEMAGTITNTL